MPRLSARFIHASMIYLALGFTLGSLLLANKGILFSPWTWTLLPAHMEFLLVGWIVQLTMGMAFWIFPRFATRRPRGNENLVQVSFVLLNVGLWLAAIQPFSHFNWLTPLGRTLEAASVLLFMFSTWSRVKSMRI